MAPKNKSAFDELVIASLGRIEEKLDAYATKNEADHAVIRATAIKAAQDAGWVSKGLAAVITFMVTLAGWFVTRVYVGSK